MELDHDARGIAFDFAAKISGAARTRNRFEPWDSPLEAPRNGLLPALPNWRTRARTTRGMNSTRSWWIALCAMLCSAEDCSDMALFGRAKEPFLRQFLQLRHGIPSHDTFSRVFRLLDPAQFQLCFLRFMDDFGQPLSQRSGSYRGVGHQQAGDPTGLVCTDIAWLQEHHQWPALAAIGKVERGARLAA